MGCLFHIVAMTLLLGATALIAIVFPPIIFVAPFVFIAYVLWAVSRGRRKQTDRIVSAIRDLNTERDRNV